MLVNIPRLSLVNFVRLLTLLPPPQPPPFYYPLPSLPHFITPSQTSPILKYKNGGGVKFPPISAFEMHPSSPPPISVFEMGGLRGVGVDFCREGSIMKIGYGRFIGGEETEYLSDNFE